MKRPRFAPTAWVITPISTRRAWNALSSCSATISSGEAFRGMTVQFISCSTRGRTWVAAPLL